MIKEIISKSFCFLIMAWIALFSENLSIVHAASLGNVKALDFGNVVLDPRGDIIEIDASGGPAIPRAFANGRSAIAGGSSGRLSVHCDKPGETITLIFPNRVNAKGSPNAHYIDDFFYKSTRTPIVCKGNETIDLHIGGFLHAEKNQPNKTYEFAIPITLQLDSP